MGKGLCEALCRHQEVCEAKAGGEGSEADVHLHFFLQGKRLCSKRLPRASATKKR